jgi:hypothetical protein
MQPMIQNLINGNLTDAKTQAKRYLKTGEGFQQYCDAK